MISGIRSLATTHEQVILAWTGDIEATNVAGAEGENTSSDRIKSKKVPFKDLSQEDKVSLEAEIRNYQSALDLGPDKKKLHYVPVLLEDKIAHGHYEGYCKSSKHSFIPCFHSSSV
jgi:trehalose 6-phosphate synthase/phosphatase